jgi:hypothetical protein
VLSELDVVWTMLYVDWSRVSSGRPITVMNIQRKKHTWVISQDR